MNYIIFRRETTVENGVAKQNKIIKDTVEDGYDAALDLLMKYNLKSKRHIYEMEAVRK